MHYLRFPKIGQPQVLFVTEHESMLNNITTHFVGLDAHQAFVAIAVADSGRGFPRILPTIPNDFKTLSKVLKKLGDLNRLICCYEAGQTGYGLYRRLKKAGIRSIVIAPYGDRTCIAGGPTTKTHAQRQRVLGSLSAATMAQIDNCLKVALGLRSPVN
jgi:hypothetical protein